MTTLGSQASIKYIPNPSLANVNMNTIHFYFNPLQSSLHKQFRFLILFPRLLNLIDHYVDRMQLTYLILGTTRRQIYVFTSCKIKINETPSYNPFIPYAHSPKGISGENLTPPVVKEPRPPLEWAHSNTRKKGFKKYKKGLLRNYLNRLSLFMLNFWQIVSTAFLGYVEDCLNQIFF